MKILVAIPYHNSKSYCINELLEAVESLTYKNKDVVMRFDTEEYGGQDNVKKQREYFRKMVLDNDYDALYFMGCDTLPPADILERLLAHNKSIVGGVYWGRAGAGNGLPTSAVAWIHEMSIEEKDKLMMSGDMIKLDGMGMDCVLFKREVLEKVSWLDWEHNDDDYPLYDKCRQLGYDIWIDTSIQCNHYSRKGEYSYCGKTHLTNTQD